MGKPSGLWLEASTATNTRNVHLQTVLVNSHLHVLLVYTQLCFHALAPALAPL